MTPPQARAMLCERTREWAALRLDGELSEFETTLMTAHLERCAECRQFESEVSGFTRALRAAPLERLEVPVSVRPAHRLLRTRHVQAAAAAALLLVAAALGSAYGALRSPAAQQPSGQIARAPMVAFADDDLRKLRLQDLRASRPLTLGAAKPVLRISV